MSKDGQKIIEGLEDALAFAKGEKPAARVVYADIGIPMSNSPAPATIPDDIMQAAEQVCMDIYDGFNPPEYVDSIVRAIMAERERLGNVVVEIAAIVGLDRSQYQNREIALDIIMSALTHPRFRT